MILQALPNVSNISDAAWANASLPLSAEPINSIGLLTLIGFGLGIGLVIAMIIRIGDEQKMKP